MRRDVPDDSLPAGRFAYEGLDKVIHEKARLSILTSLVTHVRGLLFNDLKDLCRLTDGNLSRHLTVLSEAGLVEVWKGFKKNRPQTLCRLTEIGRKRFYQYLAVLEGIIADAGAVVRPQPERPAADTGDDAMERSLSDGLSPA